MSGVESESCDSVFSAERQRSMSGLLPGTLKYSWYKYCKAIRLIKALVFINEVTEGSIDQAFCFMSWRLSPLPLLSLSPIASLSLLFLHLTLTPSLIHILSGSQASFQSQDTAYSLLCKSHVYYQMTLCLSLSPSFHVSITPLAVRAALVWVLMAAQLVSLSERELALFDLAKWSARRPKWEALNIRVHW